MATRFYQTDNNKPTINELSKAYKDSKEKTRHVRTSKTGKKFHIEACPFAKNIKPKYKIRFKSKTKALNEGYKPCNCVK